eukprot:10571176-Alexandrium_andersonii.AAC.1
MLELVALGPWAKVAGAFDWRGLSTACRTVANHFRSRPGSSSAHLRRTTVWVSCADAGSDQVAAQKLMKPDAARLAGVLCVDARCLLHQYHLMAKYGLRVLDKVMARHQLDFKFYGDLAQIMNCWRDYGRRVYRCRGATVRRSSSVEICQ